jgi:hypothetical protein
LGKTHGLAGALIGGSLAEFVLHDDWRHTLAFAGFTGALALWPDVDQCGSTVSRSLGFFSNLIAMFIRKISGGHRHGTHAAVGILLTAGLAWIACRFLPSWPAEAFLAIILTFSVSGFLEALHILRSHAADVTAIAVSAAVIWLGFGLAMIPLAVLVGCSAHVLFDLGTDSGVMLGYPFSKYHVHLLPEPLAFTTGTKPEKWIVVPLLMMGLGILALNAVNPGVYLHL